MTEAALLAQQASRELVDVLLDLSLVSHVRGTSYDPVTTSGGEAIGLYPTGGTDRKGDREESYRQKTAEFFTRRLNGLLQGVGRMSDQRAETIRDEILDEATTALHDWRKTPRVPGQDPDAGTRSWKIQVANDGRSSRVIARHYGISHVSVLRYRRQYYGIAD